MSCLPSCAFKTPNRSYNKYTLQWKFYYSSLVQRDSVHALSYETPKLKYYWIKLAALQDKRWRKTLYLFVI